MKPFVTFQAKSAKIAFKVYDQKAQSRAPATTYGIALRNHISPPLEVAIVA